MKKTSLFLGIVAALVILSSAYLRVQSAPVMANAANNFLASLTDEQKAVAVFQFDDKERFNWHFIPRERKGLALKDMKPYQKHLAHALMSAGLSQSGYMKATSIMSMEDILRIMENDSGVRRNPEGYYFSIFGNPTADGTWAYRVEGHHLAFNFTIAKERVAASPNFMGTNPAEVREGPRKGLRVLHAEEDLARNFMASLTPEQKKVAIVSADAYKDIITMASRTASLENQPKGLQVTKLNAKQRQLLTAVVDEYINNFPEQIAEARRAQFTRAANNVYFAWAGTEERGKGHYYRIQAPEFLIEYDNTQNNANHVHAVWRDFKGDFGDDLLAEHYKSSPHHQAQAKHRH